MIEPDTFLRVRNAVRELRKYPIRIDVPWIHEQLERLRNEWVESVLAKHGVTKEDIPVRVTMTINTEMNPTLYIDGKPVSSATVTYDNTTIRFRITEPA